MDDVSNISGERQNQLERACTEMKAYCKKLVTGEEVVCQSNRYKNLLSSSQLSRLMEKFEMALYCIDANEIGEDEDW